MTDLSTLTDEQLSARALAVTSRINDAYWRFTRSARGVPPSMSVPDAYEERRAITSEMRRRASVKRSKGATW